MRPRDFPNGTPRATPTRTATAARPPRRCSTSGGADVTVAPARGRADRCRALPDGLRPIRFGGTRAARGSERLGAIARLRACRRWGTRSLTGRCSSGAHRKCGLGTREWTTRGSKQLTSASVPVRLPRSKRVGKCRCGSRHREQRGPRAARPSNGASRAPLRDRTPPVGGVHPRRCLATTPGTRQGTRGTCIRPIRRRSMRSSQSCAETRLTGTGSGSGR